MDKMHDAMAQRSSYCRMFADNFIAMNHPYLSDVEELGNVLVWFYNEYRNLM